MDGVSAGGSVFKSAQFRQLGLFQQHGIALIRLLFLTDSVIIYYALVAVAAVEHDGWTERDFSLGLLGLVAFGVVTSFGRLYRSWRLIRLRYELVEIAISLSIAFGAVGLIVTFSTNWGTTPPAHRLIVAWYGLALLSITVSRIVVRLSLRYYRAAGHDHRTAAFVGATSTSRELARIFRDHPWMGIEVVGIYDDASQQPAGADRADAAADCMEQLWTLVRENKISVVYITLPMEAARRTKQIIEELGDSTVSIYYCPMLNDFGLLNAQWDDIYGHPVVSVVASPFDGAKRYVKRIEDVVIALMVIPLILIPITVAALAIKLTSPGPVFYNQTRYGLGGRPFKIRKLRTMYTVDSDADFVQAKKGDSRITKVGGILRRTSLDELPQFFNVLQGQMSVVGPRPAPVKYNETHRKIIYRYMMRHKIKPGITGLAQVNGCRGETESIEKTEERTNYDLEYMNAWSLWLDLRIMVKTVVLILGDLRLR